MSFLINVSRLTGAKKNFSYFTFVLLFLKGSSYTEDQTISQLLRSDNWCLFPVPLIRSLWRVVRKLPLVPPTHIKLIEVHTRAAAYSQELVVVQNWKTEIRVMIKHSLVRGKSWWCSSLYIDVNVLYTSSCLSYTTSASQAPTNIDAERNLISL